LINWMVIFGSGWARGSYMKDVPLTQKIFGLSLAL
jgi:hypothetical protein